MPKKVGVKRVELNELVLMSHSVIDNTVEQQKEKERIEKLTNTREEMLKQKKREAELHKQKTAAMYDNMAKSAPAGAEKKLDTQILRAEPKKRKSLSMLIRMIRTLPEQNQNNLPKVHHHQSRR